MHAFPCSHSSYKHIVVSLVHSAELEQRWNTENAFRGGLEDELTHPDVFATREQADVVHANMQR